MNIIKYVSHFIEETLRCRAQSYSPKILFWIFLSLPSAENSVFIYARKHKYLQVDFFKKKSKCLGKYSLYSLLWHLKAGSVQFSSVTQSCLTLCDPMDHSTPGLPVHHQLLEFTQTHVHWVGDAIQPSHPLSYPSPPAFDLSQHQHLFQWVNSSHQVAKVLEFQLQHQSFHEHPGLISFRMDWLDLLAVQGTLKSLLPHTVQKHQFFRAQLSS